jgi:hypothetical protein
MGLFKGRGEAGDVHAFGGTGAAGDDGLFAAVRFEPDLAVATVAVPAEVGVGDPLHVEELQAAEDGVVFGYEFLLAADGDLDKAFVRFEYLGVVFHGRKGSIREYRIPTPGRKPPQRPGGFSEGTLDFARRGDRMETREINLCLW